LGKACSKHEREEKSIQSFVGKSEAEKALERPRRGWEDNIKISLKYVG
jgi:hypothetical protein